VGSKQKAESSGSSAVVARAARASSGNACSCVSKSWRCVPEGAAGSSGSGASGTAALFAASGVAAGEAEGAAGGVLIAPSRARRCRIGHRPGVAIPVMSASSATLVAPSIRERR
jgi:hypothetical protein